MADGYLISGHQLAMIQVLSERGEKEDVKKLVDEIERKQFISHGFRDTRVEVERLRKKRYFQS